jgi:hypothetical protein
MSLQLLRLTPKGKFALLAETNDDDAEELARCFLADPRDDITAVFVYNPGAQQFRGTIHRGERRRRAA